MLHIYPGTAQLSPEIPWRNLLNDLSICPSGPRALGAQLRDRPDFPCDTEANSPGAQPALLVFSRPEVLA